MTADHDKKRLADFIKHAGWHPYAAAYRREFEECIRLAAIHVREHRDPRHISMLLEKIADSRLRRSFIDAIEKSLPLKLNPKTSHFKLDKRKASKTFDEVTLPWPRNRFGVLAEDSEAAVAELVEDMIDAVILHRNSFTLDQMARLGHAVAEVGERLAKKPPK